MSEFQNLIKSIQFRDKKVEKCPDGWKAYIQFNLLALNDLEKRYLSEALSGKLSDDVFKAYIVDNSQHPIIFLKENYAFDQIYNYDVSIEKKIEFYFVINKRISFKIPKIEESLIKWIN